ncbi:hypothetical protein ACOMHN_038118 [Nucella lapillus]
MTTQHYGAVWMMTQPYGAVWMTTQPYSAVWMTTQPYGAVWMTTQPYGAVWMTTQPYGAVWITIMTTQHEPGRSSSSACVPSGEAMAARVTEARGKAGTDDCVTCALWR